MEKYDCHPATHPFIHELKLTRAQRIRGLILGSVLVPLRVLFATLFFLLMWLIAPLQTAGLSKEERARPIQGWRRWFFHPIICQLSRAVFFSLGFLWLKVKGRRASLKEAPVLVVAPHSSFLDMLILCPTQLPTVVSRSENASLPIIGAMLNFNQSVLVSRKDPESRKKAVSQLNERLTSNGYWPQMLMFPEGTTTNGRVLIKFKPGAFLAGVPVQPVLLHYPNKLGEIVPGHNMIFVQASVCILLPIRDTVRWTYRGTTWTEVLWNTLSQFYTNMTVEFLPVYNPSPEEKEDPSLYADNVQKLMAKALGIPATDFVMEGRFPVSKLGGLSLPVQTESPPRETLSLLYKHGLKEPEVEAALKEMIDRCQSQSQESTVSAKELGSILGLTDRETAVTICSLFSKDESVDLRQVCLSVAAISGFFSFKFLLHTGFSLFDSEGKGSLNAQTLSGLMGALLGIPQLNISQLYAEASSEGQVTEENLLRVLTTHQTYQRVVHEYLQPETLNTLLNGKTVNNNANALHNGNGSLHYKKSE